MKRGKDLERESLNRRDFLKFSGLCGGMMVLGDWGNVTSSVAAEAYPSKRLLWIVPHAPGAGEDIIARGVSIFLEKHLKSVSPNPSKVEIVIHNLPGEAIRGVNRIHEAKPDGYTFGNGSESVFTLAVMGTLGFDPFDLTYLAGLSSGKKVLVTGKKSNLRTWDDLVKASQKAPLKIGINAFGASNHVAAIMFVETTHLAARLVFAQGAAQVNSLLIRGDFPLAMQAWDSCLPLISAKEILPVLTFSREIEYPGAQSIKEIGFPDLMEVLNSQRYIIAPPKVPASIKNILEDALRKSMEEKEFIAWSEKVGQSFIPVIGPDFDKVVKRYISFYKSNEAIIRKYLIPEKS